MTTDDVFDLAGVINENEAAEQSWQVVERQWQAYVDRLGAEPGIVITQSEARGDKFILSGLRDPLAVDPLKFLDETGIDPARVVARFDPYQALDPQFVLERLQASLTPPPGVTLSVYGDRIVAQGSASSPWIARARAAGRLLPAGAPVFDVSAARNISEGALGKLRDTIQARSIRFDSGVSLPAAGQEKILDEIASELNELATLASSLNVVTRVTLTGHSDDKGQGTSNLSLSVARAETVRALLKKRGVDPDLLAVRSGERGHPSLERLGLLRIVDLNALDALADFAEHKNAQENIGIDAYQAATLGGQRSPLRTSETTLVSIK